MKETFITEWNDGDITYESFNISKSILKFFLRTNGGYWVVKIK